MESGLKYFFPGECYQKVVLDFSFDGQWAQSDSRVAECPPRFAACPVKRVCMCVCVGGGGGGGGRDSSIFRYKRCG